MIMCALTGLVSPAGRGSHLTREGTCLCPGSRIHGKGPRETWLLLMTSWSPHYRRRQVGYKILGLVRDLNPGPLAPEARIIPLDQQANLCHRKMRSREISPQL